MIPNIQQIRFEDILFDQQDDNPSGDGSIVAARLLRISSLDKHSRPPHPCPRPTYFAHGCANNYARLPTDLVGRANRIPASEGFCALCRAPESCVILSNDFRLFVNCEQQKWYAAAFSCTTVVYLAAKNDAASSIDSFQLAHSLSVNIGWKLPQDLPVRWPLTSSWPPNAFNIFYAANNAAETGDV